MAIVVVSMTQEGVGERTLFGLNVDVRCSSAEPKRRSMKSVLPQEPNNLVFILNNFLGKKNDKI